MKKLELFIMAAALWGAFSPAMTFAQKKDLDKTNKLVRDAAYYIDGQYSAKSVKDENGNYDFQYRLTDITTRHINFVGSRDTLIGDRTGGYCQFVFEKAETDPPEKGFKGGLKFYRWDDNLKQWIPDSEVKNGEFGVNENKVATIMLVLDCSSSLGKDFEKLKKAAKNFIRTIRETVPNGNVHIGIIGFNTMYNTNNMKFGITQLTRESYPDMRRFINSLTADNNTVYYYAMHKSSGMLDDYYRQKLSRTVDSVDYAGSYIVSFTDGYDNQSIDPKFGDLDEGVNNPYFKFVRDSIINNHNVGDQKLESFVISLMGKDVAVGKDKFEGILQNLASNEEQYYNVDNINELKGKFEDIANNLVNRWSNLSCYVPPSGKGRVRWIMEGAEPRKGGYFSGYLEQMNIYNLDGGDLYSTGGNLSLGKEWNDRFYLGFGLGCYYLTYEAKKWHEGYYFQEEYWPNSWRWQEGHYSCYSDKFLAADLFIDMKLKFFKNTVITPVMGLKLGAGVGHCLNDVGNGDRIKDGINIVTRPSLGLLFRLKGHSELMLNVEYVPALFYNLNGISLNVGFKFGKL